MTPEAAAEGRRLLDNRLSAEATGVAAPPEHSAFTDWLWANREELARCAELVTGRTQDGASAR